MRRSRAALAGLLCALGMALYGSGEAGPHRSLAADFAPAARDGFGVPHSLCAAHPGCGLVWGFHADGLARVLQEQRLPACPLDAERGPATAARRPEAWRYWYEHPSCCPETASCPLAAPAGRSTLVIGDLSRLAADSRHSSGGSDVGRLIEANDGLDDPRIVWPARRVAGPVAAAPRGPQGPRGWYPYGCEYEYFIYHQAYGAASANVEPRPIPPRSPAARQQSQRQADDWLRHEYECQFGCAYESRCAAAHEVRPALEPIARSPLPGGRGSDRKPVLEPIAPVRPADPCHPGWGGCECPEADWWASESFAAPPALVEEIVREDLAAKGTAHAAASRRLATAAAVLQCLADWLVETSNTLGRVATEVRNPQTGEGKAERPAGRPATRSAEVPQRDAYLGL